MLRRRRVIAVAAALLGAAVLPLPAAAAAPQVVVSIKPIHSLLAGVMAGIGEPALIVAGSSSPHVYTLRPSDARKLEAADIVFWVGPILEGFLTKPISSLAGKAEIVELDPGNAERYRSNAAALERRLDALDARLRQRLEAVRGLPFVVFHDAYQYFDRRYGLFAIGSITVSPEHLPGAQRIQAIRAKVARVGAACVFSEPQFEPLLVQTVIEGTRARTAVLDPEGAALRAGPELYFTLMDGLADALAICLGQ